MPNAGPAGRIGVLDFDLLESDIDGRLILMGERLWSIEAAASTARASAKGELAAGASITGTLTAAIEDS